MDWSCLLAKVLGSSKALLQWKSRWQALSKELCITNANDFFQERDPLPFTYFSIFDGHAGTGAALMAVNTLHDVIKVKSAEKCKPSSINILSGCVS